jgi:hypothetical protein
VTWSAVEHVPGCDYAGISLIERSGRIITVAATDDVVRRIDATLIPPHQRSTRSATPELLLTTGPGPSAPLF